MISIVIYSNDTQQIEILRSYIQDFLIEIKAMAKVIALENKEEFFMASNYYDIYIMDMDAEKDIAALGAQIAKINNNIYFIYLSENRDLAYEAIKARGNYFILKPVDKVEFFDALHHIKQQIRSDSVIVKTANGEQRLRINYLNYINIIKRCLCYHLANGSVFDGQTLRSSFEKAIYPLQQHESILFLPPSLLINIGRVKAVNKDHVIFDNGEILYFPKKAYDTVRETWINYSGILD